tara:strand:- start:1390 stop:2076 length:687 start_codon:yes stop_codon:yes gene_type:complete
MILLGGIAFVRGSEDTATSVVSAFFSVFGTALVALIVIHHANKRLDRQINTQNAHLKATLGHQRDETGARLRAEAVRDHRKELRQHYGEWRARAERLLAMAARSEYGQRNATPSAPSQRDLLVGDVDSAHDSLRASAHVLLLYEDDPGLRDDIERATQWTGLARYAPLDDVDAYIAQIEVTDEVDCDYEWEVVRKLKPSAGEHNGLRLAGFARHLLNATIDRRRRLWQ